MKILKILPLFFILFYGKQSFSQIEQLWKTDYQITSDTFNTFGYKTDSAGNFYLYGWQHNRVFLQKHDANGNIEWTINDNSILSPTQYVIDTDTFDQPFSNSRITDLIVEGDVGIYAIGIQSVGGFNEPNPEAYVFISKLTRNGILQWKRNFSLSFSQMRLTPWNHNAKVFFDRLKRELYVAHSRQAMFCNGQYDTDFGIIKCDSSGNLLWNQWFVGDSNNCTKDIVTSLFFQDTFIGFSGFTSSPYSNLSKLISISLDKNGNLIRRVEEDQYIADPYSDQSLNLYLPDKYSTTGQSKGPTTFVTAQTAASSQTNKRNLLVLKYDVSLNRIWRYDLQKDSSVNIEVEKSMIDDSSNLFVSAIWKENGSKKAFFLKLDSSGKEVFRDTFSTAVEIAFCFINGKSEYLVSTSSLKGSVYTTSIKKYRPSGEIAWDTTLSISGKILRGWVDSDDIYLVLQKDRTLSYVKFKDKDLSISLKSIAQNWLNVFPNPATDILYVNNPNQESQTQAYRIYTPTGKLVSSGETTLNGIPLAGLAPGLYFLKLIHSNNQISATKFFKQ